MRASLTSLEGLLLTHTLPNCAVAIVELPFDTGLSVRLHDGTVFTIPSSDFPIGADGAEINRIFYKACLARQRPPVA